MRGLINLCDIKNCRGDTYLTYYGHNVCQICWEKHCDEEINLKEIFEVEE